MTNLSRVMDIAASKNIMIAIETMDDVFANSVEKVRKIKNIIHSPWLQAYADLGNISAWPENNPVKDLTEGIDNIVAVHVKDTLKVTDTFNGKFKDVDFGSGEVNFRKLLDALNKAGYKGTFTIEMWSEKNEDCLQKVEKAYSYVFDLLAKSGFSMQEGGH